MFADTASPTRSLATVVEAARRSLASAAVLRPLIILSFLLYETPYLRRLSTGEPWLALPLWDVGKLVDDPRTFVALEAIYLCASVVACIPRFVVPGCFVAGSASILLVSFDLTYRLQFAFLPGGALFAFALSEILTRTNDPRRRIDLPFVLLLGSVYGFASFHKAFNFQWMKTLLPSSVFTAGGPVPAFCASADSWFLGVIAWTVVPYEALLAVLTLSRRCLKPRLACVWVFHWLLVAMVPFIWHVSLFMLCLHLYLASLQRPVARRRMFVGRNWFVLVGAEVLFALGKNLAPSIGGPAGSILGAAAFANLALFPVMFFYWPFWREKREDVVGVGASVATGESGPSRSAWARIQGWLRGVTGGLSGWRGASVSAFGVLVLVFGFSPFLLEKHYSVLSLGWSMFAGGEYRDGSYFMLRVPKSACFRYPLVNNMIWIRANEQQVLYLAFRRNDLERLKRFLERRNCGGPPLQIETGKF